MVAHAIYSVLCVMVQYISDFFCLMDLGLNLFF